MHATQFTERDFALHTMDSAPAASREALGWYQSNFNLVPNLARVMAEAPALLLSYWQTQLNLLQKGKLTPREINIVEMTVAHRHRCQYCVAGHTAFGMLPPFNNTKAEMDAVRTDADLDEPKLNGLREFTIQVLENQGRISQQQLNDFLGHGYTQAHAMDVVAGIAAKVMSNFTNQLVLTPLDAAFAQLTEGLTYKDARGIRSDP